MSKYFAIHNGPRGCFMPDTVCIIRCDTRRELKRYLAHELADMRDAGFTGAAQRNAATLAASLWREANKPHPDWREHVIPLAPSHAPRNYCYALGGSVSSRREYLENSGED